MPEFKRGSSYRVVWRDGEGEHSATGRYLGELSLAG